MNCLEQLDHFQDTKISLLGLTAKKRCPKIFACVILKFEWYEFTKGDKHAYLQLIWSSYLEYTLDWAAVMQ